MKNQPHVDTSQPNPAGNVLTIVSLKVQGKLQKGDVISTDVLGECSVQSIPSTFGALYVRQKSTQRLVFISGIDFPKTVTMNTRGPRDPREDLVQRRELEGETA